MGTRNRRLSPLPHSSPLRRQRSLLPREQPRAPVKPKAPRTAPQKKLGGRGRCRRQKWRDGSSPMLPPRLPWQGAKRALLQVRRAPPASHQVTVSRLRGQAMPGQNCLLASDGGEGSSASRRGRARRGSVRAAAPKTCFAAGRAPLGQRARAGNNPQRANPRVSPSASISGRDAPIAWLGSCCSAWPARCPSSSWPSSGLEGTVPSGTLEGSVPSFLP